MVLTGGIGISDGHRLRNLWLVIVLPSLIPVIAAIIDGNLRLGSVTGPAGHGPPRPGMSFLGDTMVWPCFVLVPMSMLLLGYAVGAVCQMSRDVSKLIEVETANQESNAHVKFVRETRAKLKGQNGWQWSTVTAYCAGFAYWLYNFIVCTFEIHLPSKLEWVEQFLNPYDGYAKWDVGWDQFFASWLAVRVWALFGYGLETVIVVKALHLVAVVRRYASWLRSSGILTIRPLSPDQRGGLASLSRASLATVWLLIPLSFLAFLAAFKESIPGGPQGDVLMIVLALAAFLFTLPIWSARNAIFRAKVKYLEPVSKQYEQLSSKAQKLVNASNPTMKEIALLNHELEILCKLYDRAARVRVWPVERETAFWLVGAVLVPMALLVVRLTIAGR